MHANVFNQGRYILTPLSSTNHERGNFINPKVIFCILLLPIAYLACFHKELIYSYILWFYKIFPMKSYPSLKTIVFHLYSYDLYYLKM